MVGLELLRVYNARLTYKDGDNVDYMTLEVIWADAWLVKDGQAAGEAPQRYRNLQCLSPVSE